MRNVILNPTKQIAQKINRTIEQHYQPGIKQALFVFTTNIGDHPIYKMSLDTFPAIGSSISTMMVSEIPTQDITKQQYVLMLFEIYKRWPRLPFVLRGYTPKQVRWFRQKFGKRVFNEHTTVNWWKDII
ncbi:hypothetical protein H5S09_00780 [Limosilactobacillus sp. STM2_1]|uniref:Uncharacterized protein n=1 Tax=Limosilactobacillus rudii TaxID=2759755 RepID=A0A7W3UJ23_9LACO|nr:hypothetical protein [Limosilactobacillus rudii]MBB1078377.1 hypothetical protein [Limosilactobacillus rudii]MBB1096507.1 hypothetical protein [Limosilactobacillus rudii]MCD7134296.1 hypothetical protein [Limosilactobacillus rudii]